MRCVCWERFFCGMGEKVRPKRELSRWWNDGFAAASSCELCVRGSWFVAGQTNGPIFRLSPAEAPINHRLSEAACFYMMWESVLQFSKESHSDKLLRKTNMDSQLLPFGVRDELSGSPQLQNIFSWEEYAYLSVYTRAHLFFKIPVWHPAIKFALKSVRWTKNRLIWCPLEVSELEHFKNAFSPVNDVVRDLCFLFK